jgi:hypothetical protein
MFGSTCNFETLQFLSVRFNSQVIVVLCAFGSRALPHIDGCVPLHELDGFDLLLVVVAIATQGHLIGINEYIFNFNIIALNILFIGLFIHLTLFALTSTFFILERDILQCLQIELR